MVEQVLYFRIIDRSTGADTISTLFHRFQMKNALQEILDQYDTQMIQLHNDLECLKQLQEHEKCELQHYQVVCEFVRPLFNFVFQVTF